MLDVLNRYAHGFVVVPVVLACRRGGVLSALESKPHSAEELVEALGGNLGHLQVSLRLLQSLGWIERRIDDRFVATAELAKHKLIPEELWTLVVADMDAYLRGGRGGFLGPWIEKTRARWGIQDTLLADFFDSLLIIPVLALLTKRKILKDLPGTDFAVLPTGVAEEVISLLRTLGWLEGSKGSFKLTPPGEFMFERAMNLGVCASYRPMLSAMDKLLFGDAMSVFALDTDGRETHVDRAMNVIASGFMHDRYFAEVEQILISIFSREPLSAQPRYVADMGSGDGTFLKRVYETVRDKTPRGKRLGDFPLTMIGIDLNQASLEETKATLTGERIPHLVVPGDISDPRKAVEDLVGLGVDPDTVLHIRSFLDHDRPYIPPVDQASVAARATARYVGAYADRKGNGIAPAAVVQSLVEHLRRWTDVTTRHGLIMLEVHSQDPRVVRHHMDETESLYFDAIQGYSQQLLVEADVALMAAAEAGLFPQRGSFRKFPAVLPYCRITMSLFERRPYSVRLARQSDIHALRSLENACWAERMRLSEAEIHRRIAAYPSGQWVLEMNDAVVGVVYSQRIASVDRLRDARFDDLPDLHDETGSVVQLLSLNVLPEFQHLGLGYELLDLMLLRSALLGGVRQVAGVTRCKDFRGNSVDELRSYIARQDGQGRPVDPVLQFHHSHGARFIGPVTNFRPADTDNLGCGVLLCYDLGASGATLDPENSNSRLSTAGDIRSRLEACLQNLLGPSRRSAFSWQRSLRDIGLDSLGLLEFRTLLQQNFGRQLSPTFFFSHPTLTDIERFLREALSEKQPETLNAPQSRPSLDRRDAGLTHAQRTGQTGVTGEQIPIAIVGMAGRFAGCEDLDEYWQLLEQGRDAITEVPVSRWPIDDYYSDDPDAPGKMVSRFGGFLAHHDEFDAAFFGIASREAELMDPQQRLLLELHWEALESAGIDPNRLYETSCGLFVGLYTHDYELLQVEAGGNDLGAYYATGNSASIAAGRIAYFLGTRGPALTIDTACSSSLVAVHQAIRSLRSGESDLALASGASLLLSPRLSIAFSKAGMLAPDGRCKTFDAAANGYVRSEGCGVVVLKRLDDAQRDGDRVLAVLRGSAINQDGASNGLTAPSLAAQAALLRLALRDAGLQPSDVDYIEAHGTGTSLGDPVEFDALKQVFGGDAQRTTPLWLASAKTSIGHAEAAAGIAGLIKVVLAMVEERLPAHLHFTTPNQHIELSGVPARIPTRTVEWNRSSRPLRAGVSSFGFSGTNAHVVAEQAVDLRSTTSPEPGPWRVLALSAKSAPALQATISRYKRWIEAHPDAALADVCYTAAIGRAHHPCRVAFAASSRADLITALQSQDKGAATAITSPRRPPRVAFLFTGQGSQYVGMARELSLSEPAFRDALAECRSILADELEQSLEDILYPPTGVESKLSDTANTQPALFAVEYALAQMMRSWGIEPVGVLGHSVGEYVAACVAGVFSLEQGLRLIAARGRLMQSLPREGSMVAVLGPIEPLLDAVRGRSDVAVAAYNGPESIVLSGRRAGIEELSGTAIARGLRVVPLQVSHAFHSMLMEPILPAFREVARWVEFSKPQLAFASNVTGTLVGDEVTSPDYWVRHVRDPVRFHEGVRALAANDVDVMLEIGPHPVLSTMGPLCVPADPKERIAWVGLLESGSRDWDSVSSALGTLYERGADIDWRRLPATGRRRLNLPSYAWQRKRFWFSNERSVVTHQRLATSDAEVASSLFETGHIPFSRLDDEFPRARVDFIPSGREIAAFVARERDVARTRFVGSAIRQQIDVWCRDTAVAALRSLGWAPQRGQRVLSQRLVSDLGVLPRFERLIDRVLEMLVEDGFLERNRDEYRIVDDLPKSSTSLFQLASKVPECHAELRLLERCSKDLGRVLRGVVDPLDLLFPGGDLTDAVAVYTKSPFAMLGNAMAVAAVRRVAESLPKGRTLRILEVGAGTGGTTTEVLAVVPAESTEYVFTDVSQAFLDTARDSFVRYPFLRYELLNIELDVQSQGFALGQFDIVIAANVLHAAADLKSAVKHAAALLAPGGLLLLVEGLERTRWVDLVFGLMEGWWRFTDTTLRPNYPLLNAEQWKALCVECGLEAIDVTPSRPNGEKLVFSAADLFNQGIVLARAPDRSGSVDVSVAAMVSEHEQRWLVLPDNDGVANAVLRSARSAGIDCGVVDAGDNALSETLTSHRASGAVVIDLRALNRASIASSGEGLRDQATKRGMSTIMAVRAAASAHAGALCIATRGARAVGVAEQPDLAAATLCGLGNVARAEYPTLDVRLVDLDPTGNSTELASCLQRELLGKTAEWRVAYRGGQRFVPTLFPSDRHSGAIRVKDDGVYLVVGGLGDLGIQTARWLVDAGARRVVLIGRTGLPPQSLWSTLERDATVGPKIELVRAMQRKGAEVRIECADIGDRARLRGVLEGLKSAGWAPLSGVVQATAAISAQLLSDVTEADYRKVLTPKIAGTWHLFEELRDQQLDFFLLYSSLGALLGLPGQASYAAANGFLDALAHFGRAAGVPLFCINWCGWRDTGIARTDAGQRSLAELELLGVNSLSSAQAVGLLGPALAAGKAQVAILPLVPRVAANLAGLDPLVAHAARARRVTRAVAIDAPGQTQKTLANELAALSDERKLARMLDVVIALAAELLDVEPATITPHASLGDLGMDSLLGLEFRKALQAKCGMALPSTLVWSYPTAHAIASYFVARLPRAATDRGHAPPLQTESAGRTPGDTAPVLAAVEHLSEEEALRRLTSGQ